MILPTRRTARLFGPFLAASFTIAGCCRLAAQAQIGIGSTGARTAPGALSPADERLVSELETRNMQKLAEYFFDKNHVPPEAREAAKFSLAWIELTTDAFNKLPQAEQKRRIASIVAAIDSHIASMHNPKQLHNQASALIVKGESRYINTLEYWGENPKTQAALNPIAETVDKIQTKAIAEANVEASKLLNEIKNSDDPRLKKWEEADGMEQLVRYTQGLSRYNLALSLGRANPRRKEICDQAIEALKQYDVPEQTVQVQARLGIAKLAIAKGDYVMADKYFELVKKDPKASVGDAYQAHYFDVVADMYAKKYDEAKAEHQDLLAWQKAKLPPDPATQNGAAAASSMLEYRIAAAEGNNEKAIAVLMDLVGKRPDLKQIIFEQILEKLPPNPEMAKLDLLLLEAMITRGEQAAKTANPKEALPEADQKDIERAVLAGNEIVARAKAKQPIPAAEVRSASFRVPILLQRLGKLGEAADGFMDFVERYPKDENAQEAVDQALPMVYELRKDPKVKEEPVTLRRFDRALQLGVDHSHPNLAYALGLRYQDKKAWKQAADTFAKVPASSEPTQLVMARYFQMHADNELLRDKDAKLSAADRAAVQTQLQSLADEVTKGVDAATAVARDEKNKKRLQSVRVLTVLTACENARANKDFKRTVELLAGIEGKISGLPDAEAYLSDALYQRFVALSALGQNEPALATLQQLIGGNAENPQKNVDMISNFLAKLDEEYTAAKEAKNLDAAYSLGGQRAQLSALLIKQLDKDPKNANRVAYLKFNAKAQRQAAELEKDPGKEQTYLTEAMSTYVALLKDSPNDDGLKFEIALTTFALAEHDPKQYVDAQKALQEIVGRLGKPELTVMDAQTHEEKREPNKAYWQGVYELLRASVEVSKLDPSRGELLTQAKDGLRQLLILYPDPPFYKEEFAKLLAEILPGWDPNSVPTTGPAPKTPVAATPAGGK